MNNSIKFVFLSFLAALLILGCKSTPGQQSVTTATKPTYKYNVTDEALIDASPEKVYSAIVDEADGKTNWWQPALSSKIRKGKCYAEVGTN